MDIRTSPLVLGAYEARRKTFWLVAWVIAFGVGVILTLGVVTSTVESLLDAEPGSYAAQWAELVGNAGTILVIFLWLRFYERRSFASVGFRGGGGLGRGLAGFVGGILLFTVPVLILWGTGQYSSSGSEHSTVGMSALWLVLLVIPVWVVQASAEEIVTRGYLLQNNATQLPGWLAIALVSVGFGVVHFEFSPIPLAVIILVGLTFAFIALAQGSIWMVCGLHIGWNFAQGNVFGIAVSGLPRDVSIFAFGPVEGSSEVMTGGDFGLEGGAVALGVWAVFALLAFVYFRRAQAARTGTPVPAPAYETEKVERADERPAT